MRFANIAISASILLLSNHPTALTAAAEDEKGTLQQLMAENKDLTVQLETAEKTKGQIAKAELAVDGAQKALDHAEGEAKRKGSSLEGQATNVDDQAKASGCPWGSASTDKSFVDACNAEGAKLNAMLKSIQDQGASLEDYIEKLQHEQTRLSQATVKLFQKKKQNNAELQRLYDAAEEWRRRYNAFVFHSETYERLKKTEHGAEVCEVISQRESDEALKRAANCLQRLWDGAR